MGLKSWRERQLARADALVARADRMDAALASEKAAREAKREAAKVEADRARFESRARVLGESHAELSARAVAVGMSPEPRVSVLESRAMGDRGVFGVAAAAGALLSFEDSGGRGSHDPYRAWRDRIVVEERCALKVARGEELSVLDRASLKAARLASR